MTTTGAKGFVDTNVLLRSIHSSIALHIEAKILVENARQDGFELWISRQIIREYGVQVTRPGMLLPPLSAQQLRDKVSDMRSVFRIADDTETVTDKLLERIEEFPTAGKQIHDANIVATMLVNGIDTLLTQNVADMKRFASRIQIVPLVANPT